MTEANKLATAFAPIIKGIDIKLPTDAAMIANGVLMLQRAWNHDHRELPYSAKVEATPELLTVTFTSLHPSDIELRKTYGIDLYGL